MNLILRSTTGLAFYYLLSIDLQHCFILSVYDLLLSVNYFIKINKLLTSLQLIALFFSKESLAAQHSKTIYLFIAMTLSG